MSYDSDDMIEKRKRRSKLRSLRNLLIFLLIVGFCGYLYIQRDAWIPKLEGIGGRYDSVTQNDGTLAEELPADHFRKFQLSGSVGR